MDDETRNPLDDLLSFPEAAVRQREDMLPSESNGWGMHLLLTLPRTITQASLVTQLESAGFHQESSAGQPGLLRFIRSDAYVWGMVSDGPPGTTSVLVSLTQAGEQGDEEAV